MLQYGVIAAYCCGLGGLSKRMLHNATTARLCSMNGPELKAWRDRQGMSQRDLAAKLDISDSAVNRWENGQDIPGPVQILLRMLIHGEMPFSEPDAAAAALEVEHFWKLRLTLSDWHKLEALATAGGFATVRDYLLALIQEDLRAARAADKGWSQDDTTTRGEAPVEGVAMLAEPEAGKKCAVKNGGGVSQPN